MEALDLTSGAVDCAMLDETRENNKAKAKNAENTRRVFILSLARSAMYSAMMKWMCAVWGAIVPQLTGPAKTVYNNLRQKSQLFC